MKVEEFERNTSNGKCEPIGVSQTRELKDELEAGEMYFVITDEPIGVSQTRELKENIIFTHK